MLFEPGDLLVMQVHYHYDDQNLADQSKVAIVDAPSGTEAPFALRVECESVE